MGKQLLLTCMVRMSNRPRNSFTDTSSSNTVRYMSAEVPASTNQLEAISVDNNNDNSAFQLMIS